MNFKFESGRSMVEMLGTLAIIGVLSVGGITGYSHAMDKYRANQTINDVMLIGIDIITQLSQQRTQAPILSADFGTQTSAGYSVSIVQNPEDATQYGVQLMGIPSDICKIVGDGLKNTVAVYVGGEEQNSQEGDPCDESNNITMEFYFEPIMTSFECNPACAEGEFCRWGECVSEQIEISKWLGDGDASCTQDSDCGECGWCNTYTGICASYEGRDCSTSDIPNGMCYWGECLPKGCTYDENKCTGKNEYCASPNSSNEEPFPNGQTGTCVTADLKPFIIDGTEYWVSNTSLSWWDADATCKAIGKRLPKVSELVENWSGDYGYHTRSNLTKQLYEKAFGGTGGLYIWSSNLYDSGQAYGVGLATGTVGCHGSCSRSYRDAYAICK